MPALTAPQVANLRQHPPSLARHYLYVYVPDDVLVGTVNGNVGKVQAVPYNLTSGDFAEVRRGHTLRVEDSSGNYRGIVRVRQRPGVVDDRGATATHIYASEHEISLNNGDLLYVKDEFRLWHVNPYIATTGAIYKDWDGGMEIKWPGPDLMGGGWTSEHLVYQPVPVMGPHSVEFLANGVATHAWDWGANSWGSDPNTGILSYSATFPNAATITPGATASSGTVTWTQQGAEWVKLDVTDTLAAGAGIVRAYPGRRLFITLDRDDLPDNCYVDFQAGPRMGAVDQGGFNMQFTVRVNAPESAFPDGALVIWFFDGGIPQDSGGNWANRSHIHFIGYIRRASTHKEPETGHVTFEATTLDGVMKALPEFPNFLENRAAGAATVWTDAVSLTVQRAAYLQMRWQSTLLEMADVLFVPPAMTPIGEHEFPEGDLYRQINALVDRDYRYRVGCDPLSTVYINKDPQFIAPASRTQATIMRIQAQDWREAIDFPEPLEPQTGYVLASGNAYAPLTGVVTPYFSQAPGPVPLERGRRDKSLSRLICTTQGALNTLSGLALAQANNDFPEVPVKLDGQYYIGHLFPMEFVTLDVQGTALPRGTKRGVDLSNEQFIPRRSTLQVVGEHALVDLSLEKVTDGLGMEGETLTFYPDEPPDPPGVDEGPDGSDWYPPAPPSPETEAPAVGDGNLLYFVDGISGHVFRTRNARAAAASVVYEDLGLVDAGGLRYISLDSWDPKNVAMVCGPNGVWKTTNLDSTVPLPSWTKVLDTHDVSSYGYSMVLSSICKQGLWMTVEQWVKAAGTRDEIWIYWSTTGGGVGSWTGLSNTDDADSSTRNRAKLEISKHDYQKAWVTWMHNTGKPRMRWTWGLWAAGTYSAPIDLPLPNNYWPANPHHRYSSNSNDLIGLWCTAEETELCTADWATCTTGFIDAGSEGLGDYYWISSYTWGTNRYWALTYGKDGGGVYRWRFHVSDDAINWTKQHEFTGTTRHVSGWPYIGERFYACQDGTVAPILISDDRGANWTPQTGTNWAAICTALGVSPDIYCCVPVWVE